MNHFFFQFNKSLIHSISDETGNDDGSLHLWNLIGHVGIVDEVARQIKSKLLFYGIRSPFSAKGRWTRQYLQWVKGLLFEREVLKVSFQSLIELYEYLSAQLVKMNKKVIELSRSEKYIKRGCYGVFRGLGS